MLQTPSIFIENSVAPLLVDLPSPVTLDHIDPAHHEREAVCAFTRAVFERSYGAQISGFFPDLIHFGIDGRTQAVVGYRPANGSGLFLEHYLDRPVEQVASDALAGQLQPTHDDHAPTLFCRRSDMVEVGNLAILDPGLARWAIAATTAFLYAAGLRWVLFTATRPLANAFRRLGLRPLALAEADPCRLPDAGAAWGSYYDGKPQVYLGDIHAGAAKLRQGGQPQPNLTVMLDRADALGSRTRRETSTVVGGGL